ncbi:MULTISPECIES: ComF family protein [unclassified Sedimentibacter]|uniref:ComF family protein n=1 Tax=unclassified Sedimentibacter TaxID=2649220 RepID=UPI0027DF25EA|nr:ComF family protein [Sedimentibacter sp. MB35-C1]WMJ77926.1 ComF family protein [Sedimentibacter sp. MB35-C1]
MNSYAESFLELIYPEKNTCFICETYDEKINDKYICSDCEKKIKKIIHPACSKCCKPIDFDSFDGLCRECRNSDRYFETSRSPYAYEGIIKKAIYSYKYYNKSYFFKFFGNCLVDYMKDTNYAYFDFIASVPIHPSKMRKRGYNQSELIARYIASRLCIPYVDALKRTKKTLKQSGQKKEDRRKNLRNAFTVKKSAQKIINSTILLVDDIYTTGSTVDECSKALIKYGAEKVYIITIAR